MISVTGITPLFASIRRTENQGYSDKFDASVAPYDPPPTTINKIKHISIIFKLVISVSGITPLFASISRTENQGYFDKCDARVSPDDPTHKFV